MTTPLIMLALLATPWLFALLIRRVLKIDRRIVDLAGILGIMLVFCFTGIGHFIKTQSMSEMLPQFVPARILLVYATGVLEMSLAFGVLFPRRRRIIGGTLIAMLLAFLQVNVFAAVNHVNMGGHRWGPIYLLIRVPLQVILVIWVWYFCIRQTSGSHKRSVAVTKAVH